MKFGHQYQESLRDGFPATWRDSAISYRQLKKCIKSVSRELAELGLDTNTLKLLLPPSKEQTDLPTAWSSDGSFQYRLEENQPSLSDCERFQPKLIFAVDEETGEPIDACLSKETRAHLQQLALEQGLTSLSVTADSCSTTSTVDREALITSDAASTNSATSVRAVRKVEVSLTSDSEFFNKLTEELSGLKTLQESEHEKLSHDIKALGDDLKQIVGPENKKSRAELDQWRRIFELYLDSRIFYSTNEMDHGSYNFIKARDHLQTFSNRLIGQEGVLKKFKRKESTLILSRFLQINAELLQNIHFHELNQTALKKILKSKL